MKGYEELHTCSYHCDRPGCIKAQRDYLAGILISQDELVKAARAEEVARCVTLIEREAGSYVEDSMYRYVLLSLAERIKAGDVR